MSQHHDSADEATTAAAATADGAQTGYFLQLLLLIRRRANFRIDMYQRGIAVADARGDVEYVCAFRHLTHMEKRDRQILEGLIDRLQRATSPRNEVISPIFRRARPVLR